MSSGKLRIVIPTKGKEGLKDIVSEVFGRPNTFTIVNIDNNEIKDVKTLENPAVSYKHGAGPIVVKTLTDLGVNTMVASEFGPGVSTLLGHFNVAMIKVKAGTRVAEAINQFFQ